MVSNSLHKSHDKLALNPVAFQQNVRFLDRRHRQRAYYLKIRQTQTPEGFTIRYDKRIYIIKDTQENRLLRRKRIQA